METVAELLDGKRLRELRLDSMLTQRELGNASGVAPETINRIENHDGPRRVAALTVRKLARALGVEADELMG